jgi:hypothetical protein
MVTTPAGTANAAALFLGRMAAASTLAILVPLAAAEDVGGNTAPAFSFPWLSPSNDTNGTRILPAGQNVWRRDNARETRKELNYWAAIRKAEIARLSAIYRAETQQALSAARAKADAYRAFASVEAKAKMRLSPGTDVAVRSGRNESVLSGMTEAAAAQIRSAQDTVQNAANRLGQAIEGSFSPDHREKRAPSSPSVILALLVIFLMPAIAAVLLAAAFLNLRAGYRLRGATFALLGLSLSGLIYTAAFHRHNLADIGRDLLRQAAGIEVTAR